MTPQQLVSMPFPELLKMVQQTAQLSVADRQQQNGLVEEFAEQFIQVNQQQQVKGALAPYSSSAHAVGTKPTDPLQQPPVAATAQHYSTAKQYATAALLAVAKIRWFVHLRLCAWHWIKAWKEYAHTGKTFKQRPMSGGLHPGADICAMVCMLTSLKMDMPWSVWQSHYPS